jgi:hypothetical protein
MQTYFSPEEIEEHLRAGTWTSLRSDDRVIWSSESGGSDVSVHPYLRNYLGRTHEARQLWERTRHG